MVFSIDSSIFYAHTHSPILLLNKNHRGGKRDGTWSNETQINQFLDNFFYFILKYFWVLLRMKFNRGSPYFYFNLCLTPRSVGLP